MGKTSIEWATDVWNPVTGCTKVSQGCKNCYAERIANRFWKDRKFTDVRIHPDRLEDPLRWKKPRRVFVNSMSDLFHETVSLWFIARVFAYMAVAREHTFMVLTKRPHIMQHLLTDEFWVSEVKSIAGGIEDGGPRVTWPLPNVWLGVSVEDQKAADERIPLLLQTPAAVRFVSCEPLLGEVDLWKFGDQEMGFGSQYDHRGTYPFYQTLGWPNKSIEIRAGIDWVIAGGESGPGARPMHPDWARGLRDQCRAAGVPFFFKQWGEWKPPDMDCYGYELPDLDGSCTHYGTYHLFDDGKRMERVGKRFAGRVLDTREWNEFPK